MWQVTPRRFRFRRIAPLEAMLIDSPDMDEDPVVRVGEADGRSSLAQRVNHTPLVGAGVLERVEVVVGDAGVVDTSGDLEVVELAGLGVIVVLVATVSVVVVVVTGGVVVVTGGVVVVTGGVVVVVVGTVVGAGSDVTVIVDGSADTVAVVGSAVMVTVDVSVGVVVTVTVDIDVEVTVPGSGTLNVA